MFGVSQNTRLLNAILVDLEQLGFVMLLFEVKLPHRYGPPDPKLLREVVPGALLDLHLGFQELDASLGDTATRRKVVILFPSQQTFAVLSLVFVLGLQMKFQLWRRTPLPAQGAVILARATLIRIRSWERKHVAWMVTGNGVRMVFWPSAPSAWRCGELRKARGLLSLMLARAIAWHHKQLIKLLVQVLSRMRN